MTRIGPGMRSVVSVGLLAGALAGGWGRTADVRAAVGSRGDPVFWIGPGTTQSTSDDKLQISFSVSSTVQHATYAVHGPLGTAVHSVLYTGSTLSGLESYTFVADQATHRYVVVTTVTTSGVVPVTLTEQLLVAGSTSAKTAIVPGQSNTGITTAVGG